MMMSLSNTGNQIISQEELSTVLQETLVNYSKKRIDLTMLLDIVAEIEKYHKSALSPKLKRIITFLNSSLIHNNHAMEDVTAILKELTSKKG